MFCCCKAINNDGNKRLLLDVNPKTMFSDMQQSPKVIIRKKKKKKSLMIGYKTIDIWLLTNAN